LPASLRRLLHVFVALTLWVGVSLAAVWSPAVAAEGSVHVGADVNRGRALPSRLGAALCGDEESVDAEILCGGEWLFDLVGESSLLVLSRDTCSVLLEQLFGRQTCDPTTQECDRLRHSGLPPPVDSASSGGASALTVALPSWRDPVGVTVVAPSARGPALASVDSCPTTPPPRAQIGRI
jgi:hypothetical protein